MTPPLLALAAIPPGLRDPLLAEYRRIIQNYLERKWNNRNVGHVGGDVDPNHMDATGVLAQCNWVMGELVRARRRRGGEGVAEAHVRWKGQ